MSNVHLNGSFSPEKMKTLDVPRVALEWALGVSS